MKERFSYSWIVTWSLAYIACTFIKPDVITGSSPYVTGIGFLGFGIALFVAVRFQLKKLLLGCGLIQVLAGVASWSGIIQWNLPWATDYDPLAQISMAVLDLVSAAIVFHYASMLQAKTVSIHNTPSQEAND